MRARAAGALLGLTLAGCGGAARRADVASVGAPAEKPPPSVTPSPAPAPSHPAGTIFYPGASVVLAPPSEGAVPAVSAAQAAAAAQGNSPMWQPGESPDPVDIRLFLLTNNIYGPEQPDGTVRPYYVNVLAWAVVFHHVHWQGIGGAPWPSGSSPPPPPTPEPGPGRSDLVTMVDANSGKPLFSFASVVELPPA